MGNGRMSIYERFKLQRRRDNLWRSVLKAVPNFRGFVALFPDTKEVSGRMSADCESMCKDLSPEEMVLVLLTLVRGRRKSHFSDEMQGEDALNDNLLELTALLRKIEVFGGKFAQRRSDGHE